MQTKVARRTTRKAVKKTTRRAAAGRKGPVKKRQRSLSAAHKKALAEGRNTSLVIDRYVSAINQPKPRGRKVTPALMKRRLAEARVAKKSARGVDLLMLSQDIRNLEQKLHQSSSNGVTDIARLEAEFVRVAKPFAEKRGVTYGAFRDAGVSAPVLKRAGIARTRG